MSRKSLLKNLILLTLTYLVVQIIITSFGDTYLSRKLWLEHKNVPELTKERPAESEYTSPIKLISDEHFWLLRAVLIIMIVLALRYKETDYKKYVLYKNILISCILTLFIAAFLITWMLKIGIGRPRPYANLDYFKHFTLSTRFHSFPSGHTTETFSYLAPFMYFCKKRYVFFILLISGILICLARAVLAYHFLTDIAFGVYTTLFTGFYISYLVEKRNSNS